MTLSCNDKVVKEKLMTKLRNLGNHLHNMDVLKAGKGTLQVVYQEADAKDASSYVPCPHCLGYYGKKELWKHANCCQLRSASTSGRKQCVKEARNLLPLLKA